MSLSRLGLVRPVCNPARLSISNPEGCWTCKHNEVDPEREPCKTCMIDNDCGEGHTGWKVGDEPGTTLLN